MVTRMQTEASWNDLFNVQWEDAPLGPKVIRLVWLLRSLGCRKQTRCASSLVVMHFGKVWAQQKSFDARRLTDEVVEAFVSDHLRYCCYRRMWHRQYFYSRGASDHFLGMSRKAGTVLQASVAGPAYHSFLEQYCHFLLHNRGLATRAVDTYTRSVQDLLAGLRSVLAPAGLSCCSLL